MRKYFNYSGWVMAMKRFVLILFAVTFAPVLQAVESANTAPVTSAPATAASPTTATVQYREVAQTYAAEGIVEAVHQSTISAQISGQVKEIFFDVGDRVKKGQLILRIDEREAMQAMTGSQAQVMQAQAAMQNAKSNYERSRQLFAQKFISQAALDKAQADYKMALAQSTLSEATAGQSAISHGYTSVTAPYGGVVLARLVEVGEMVTIGKPLMTGFDPSELRIITNIPQYKMAEIGTRPQVLVDIPTLNRQIKAASVTVQPAADARTHSSQVRINLPANEAGIYPGMYVKVLFVTGKTSKLLIPARAVIHRSEVVAVYIIDDKGGARLRQIRLGETAGDNEIEVLAGLNPGEKVSLDPVKAGMTKQDK
jgi:RND family efflux transporter MFP subunit